MGKRNRTPWTLVEHLRGLGIEPEVPAHPAWEALENHWGSTFKHEKTLTNALLENIKDMNLPAAPLAITLYKWATRNNVELTPFRGSVNADPRVRQALCEYATARLNARHGFFEGLCDIINRLVEQGPLPEHFKTRLNDQFNQNMDASNAIAAWLAPVTGALPAISTWVTMAGALNDQYIFSADDTRVADGSINSSGHHWSKNHRMELVLAAWLEIDSKYLVMPLYNHLPNICMDTPDEVTAVFWMVAAQRIDMEPKGKESRMLDVWMEQYPEYRAFLNDKRVLIEHLMGDDPVVCGKALHHFWAQRNVVFSEQASLENLLGP